MDFRKLQDYCDRNLNTFDDYKAEKMKRKIMVQQQYSPTEVNKIPKPDWNIVNAKVWTNNDQAREKNRFTIEKPEAR